MPAYTPRNSTGSSCQEYAAYQGFRDLSAEEIVEAFPYGLKQEWTNEFLGVTIDLVTNRLSTLKN